MTKLKKNRRGAAAIEFALLLPVMMTILLGIIEYGLYFNERQLLQNILNETCGETFYTDAVILICRITTHSIFAALIKIITNIPDTFHPE